MNENLDQLEDMFSGAGEQPAPEQIKSNPNQASPAQIKFIGDLARERDIEADHRAAILARCESGDITMERARDWIERLKAKPLLPHAQSRRIRVEYEDMELDGGKTRRVGRVVTPNGGVLAGHYAIDTTNLSVFVNQVSFFHVWVGDRGGWKVFMEVSDDQVELQSWDTKRAVIGRIAEDPTAASALWGLEHSRCGVCGRRLTNDESRALGIGPVCRTRL